MARQSGGSVAAIESAVLPESLRARLDKVRQARWIEQGMHTQACDAMADVIRDLARARWAVSSRRLTTSELLDEIGLRGADEALIRPISDVLFACDLVKFAGAKPASEDLRLQFETAILLVDAYGAMPLPAEGSFLG